MFKLIARFSAWLRHRHTWTLRNRFAITKSAQLFDGTTYSTRQCGRIEECQCGATRAWIYSSDTGRRIAVDPNYIDDLIATRGLATKGTANRSS